MVGWKYDPKLSFKENRLAKELAEGRTLPETSENSKPELDPAVVVPPMYEKSENDTALDNVIDGLNVLEAYRRWIGKEVDENTTKSLEGVKVSCPLPGHRDRHPSAWLNIEKRTWFCGGCQEGGDIFDLAAIKFNYPRPDYKSGRQFHELRKDMAESFGYRVEKTIGGEIVWKEEPESAPEPEKKQDVAPATVIDDPKLSAQDTTVRNLFVRDIEDEPEDIGYPELDWKAIVPMETFLYEYMKATSKDDTPEEYHFWHGMLALGHAVGRNAFLNDTRPVFGNLLVCLLGGTGYGKSRSRYWLDEVLEAALPFRDNGLDTTGCKLVPVPASGENLINQFQHIAHDPSMPKGMPEIRTPVNGIVDYDEFAALLARASRQGATLKQIIMGFSDSRARISSSSNTGGTFEAYNPFCSITASTQPKAVRVMLTHTDTTSGFLNRWLFIGGPRKQREVMGGVHTSISVDLDPAIDKLKSVKAWGATERDVRFTPDGLDAFEKFIKSFVFPIQQADESDLLTRLDLTMKRLVLLFCVNEHKVAADADIVKRVVPILDYLVKCYGILHAEIGVTQMNEIVSEIQRVMKRIIERTGRGASYRDLQQMLKRKNYSPDLFKRALETMVALDMIYQDKEKGSVGRPTVRYRLVAGGA